MRAMGASSGKNKPQRNKIVVTPSWITGWFDKKPTMRRSRRCFSQPLQTLRAHGITIKRFLGYKRNTVRLNWWSEDLIWISKAFCECVAPQIHSSHRASCTKSDVYKIGGIASSEAIFRIQSTAYFFPKIFLIAWDKSFILNGFWIKASQPRSNISLASPSML